MLFGDGENMNWLGVLPPIIQWAIAIAIGASAVGIPLYAKIRKLGQDIKLGQVEVDSKEADVVRKEQLNAAEEFQRIIKFRDDEIKRLMERDEQQERKIQELYDKHLDCAKNEARQDERSKMNTEKILALERKVMMLEMLLHEKPPAPQNVTINTAGAPAVVKTEEPCPPSTPALIVPVS